jgi:hypothetical protein
MQNREKQNQDKFFQISNKTQFIKQDIVKKNTKQASYPVNIEINELKNRNLLTPLELTYNNQKQKIHYFSSPSSQNKISINIPSPNNQYISANNGKQSNRSSVFHKKENLSSVITFRSDKSVDFDAIKFRSQNINLQQKNYQLELLERQINLNKQKNLHKKKNFLFHNYTDKLLLDHQTKVKQNIDNKKQNKNCLYLVRKICVLTLVIKI